MNRKGFTIIEVLVSLIILSIIAIISSNILQSSLDTERDTTRQLNSIKELNLSSSIIRRDIRQIVNIPSRDFFGNTLYGTLIGSMILKVFHLAQELNLYQMKFLQLKGLNMFWRRIF